MTDKKLTWFDRMKSHCNKWLGSNFTDDTSEMETEKWLHENEEISFESRIEAATQKIKEESNLRVTELENQVLELKKTNKLEKENTDKEVAKVKEENEVSIEALSEQLSETNKLVGELAANSTAKFEAIEKENADKIKELEEVNAAKIAEMEAANKTALEARDEKHALEANALKEAINKLKMTSSGGQEDSEGTPPIEEGKQDGKKTHESDKYDAKAYLERRKARTKKL